MQKASRRIIDFAEIDRRFDERTIARLARIGRLPRDADLQGFGESIREAVRIYARNASAPTGNAVHFEIRELSKAASGRRFEKVAALLEALSPRARQLLKDRSSRPNVRWQLPEPGALLDEATRERACAEVASLTQSGGRYVEGRKSSSGERWRIWQPDLHAPRVQRTPPRREAERYFLTCLRLAWGEITGEPAPTAANEHRPGAFVEFVKECLKLVGAGNVNAYWLINDSNRRRAAAHSALRRQ